MAKENKSEQKHENAIQQSVSQEATKAQCGNRDSAARATFSQILRHNPNAMWQKELKLNIVKRGVKTDLR